jgi:hypothetical protein
MIALKQLVFSIAFAIAAVAAAQYVMWIVATERSSSRMRFRGSLWFSKIPSNRIRA